ncbi:MAG: hypothetical protein GY855_15805 [candidate division Zixibacteria bacterium]|nr:hypothetical protein [candidate division Zixibacteria bacterium]
MHRLLSIVLFSILLFISIYSIGYPSEPEVVAEIYEGTCGLEIPGFADYPNPFGATSRMLSEWGYGKIVVSDDGVIFYCTAGAIYKIESYDSLSVFFKSYYVMGFFIDKFGHYHIQYQTSQKPHIVVRQIKLTSVGEKISEFTSDRNNKHKKWLDDGTFLCTSQYENYTVYSTDGQELGKQPCYNFYRINSNDEIIILDGESNLRDESNQLKYGYLHRRDKNMIAIYKPDTLSGLHIGKTRSIPEWTRYIDFAQVHDISDNYTMIFNPERPYYGKENREISRIFKIDLKDGIPIELPAIDIDTIVPKELIIIESNVCVTRSGDIYQAYLAYGSIRASKNPKKDFNPPQDRLVVIKWKQEQYDK